MKHAFKLVEVDVTVEVESKTFGVLSHQSPSVFFSSGVIKKVTFVKQL